VGADALENHTPYAAQPLFLADENGRPVLSLVIKATYSFETGQLRMAEEQVPLLLEGTLWADSARSSYRYEPECAFFKPATDVVLVGHAYPPQPRATDFLVGLQVGPLRKVVRVIGDRTWYKSLGSIAITAPRPVESVPLCYERAFGGWDRSDPDPERHTFEPRNPVGRGFRSQSGRFEEGILLPNLEDPENPIKAFRQAVPPAGFGFLSPHWQPRARYAGTYDEVWKARRMPLLPKDFDRRFMNAASPGLVSDGYLRGNEAVSITNASRAGQLSFRLPGKPPPTFKVGLKGRRVEQGEARLDTVILDTDQAMAYLLWRALIPLSSGPHDVMGMEVYTTGGPSAGHKA